jgi:hypothetical protein
VSGLEIQVVAELGPEGVRNHYRSRIPKSPGAVRYLPRKGMVKPFLEETPNRAYYLNSRVGERILGVLDDREVQREALG